MNCAMRPLLLSLVLAAAFALPLAAFATDAPPPAVVSACQAEAAQLGKEAFTAKYGPTEPFGHCYAAHANATTTTTTTVADDPATAACKAEYVKVGPDAFKAKYGATEPFGNCLAAQKKPPVTTTSDDPATAACKAEYLKLGFDAFKAKYGATEPFGNCVAAQKKPPVTTTPADPATAACKAEYVKLGPDAFKAKYGATEPFGKCLAAQRKPLPNLDDAAKTLAQTLCGNAKPVDRCVKAALARARQIVAACKSSSGTSRDAFKACVVASVPKRP